MNKFLKEFSLIKTLRFNFHYLKFSQAVKMPVIVSRYVLFNSLKGSLSVNGKLKRGQVRIGFGSVPVFDKRRSRVVWNVGGGRVVFQGRAFIGQGTKIGSGGTLVFGENFMVTAESVIICEESITFGRDVLCSWQCQIMDTDYHHIVENGMEKPVTAPVTFGNHIWIGSRVIINKGVNIPDNTVVASGSVVTKPFYDSGMMLAGVPASPVKQGITWR